MFEGDIFEAHKGTQILAVTMILRYGIHKAYCPADKDFMDSVGFYVEAKGYPDMPIGDIESILKNHFNAGRITLAAVQDAQRTYKVQKDVPKGVYDDSNFDYAELEKIMQEKG